MDFQRIVYIIALMLMLLLIWQSWENFKQEKNPQIYYDEPSQSGTNGKLQRGSVNQADDIPSAPTHSLPATKPQPTAILAPRGKIIHVKTDVFEIEIDSIGGDIRRASLRQYPVTIDSPDQPFILFRDDGEDILFTQTGIIGAGDHYPNHRSVYTSERDNYHLEDGKETLELVLHHHAADGLHYQKIYTFYRDSYLVDITYHLTNSLDRDWAGFTYAQYVRTNAVDQSDFGFLGRLPSYKGAAYYTDEIKFEKVDFSDLDDGPLNVKANDGWISMLQHYFVTAFLPPQQQPLEFFSKKRQATPLPHYLVGYKTLQPVVLAHGESAAMPLRLYIGPKEQKRLEKVAEGLVLSVDYGWLTPISAPLFWFLQWLHGLTNNWGWAIILLTIIVKLIFFPLSAASYKSMAKMKKLQPRLQTLKERFGDDRQKLNQAMMEMYKKDKINPLGGCLPIIIQIPVFIALYWVLLESVELRQAYFLLWLKDLSVRDPYYILPITMGATMVAQHFLNPAPMDTMQKNIMMAMPVVFTIFFLWFPAGLVLYWLVNNVLSIAQQYYITRKLIKPT